MRIVIAKVADQRHERALVRLQRGARVGGEDVMVLAVRRLHAREAAIVGLHPVGRVVRAAVLVRAEPQDDDALAMRPRAVEQRVDERQVEPALLGLDLLPCDWHLDGVGVDTVEHRPNLGQCGGIVARVVHLRAQHQERRAVDHQRVATVTRGDARDGRRRRIGSLRLRLRLSLSGRQRSAREPEEHRRYSTLDHSLSLKCNR